MQADIQKSLNETVELSRFLSIYGKPEPIQDPDFASTDSQIKSLSLPIAKSISESEKGCILDIGCGRGILLNRLAEIESFHASGWVYLGADFEERLTDVLKLAAELRLHRRVEAITLKKLHASWVPPDMYFDNIIVVIRNVFHEINIEETGELINLLNKHLRASDTLLIQDLVVFPRAERGNVCWQPQLLNEVFSQNGLFLTVVEERSQHGNRWFSMAGQKKPQIGSSVDINKLVKSAREKQYVLWQKTGVLAKEDGAFRHEKIALLDLDLQLAALQKQLLEVGSKVVSYPNTNDQENTAKKSLEAQFSAFSAEDFSSRIVPVSSIPYFRDRANGQDALENFLISKSQMTLILGGPFSGKSVMVKEFLSRRAHERQVVIIQCQNTSSVWNLLEEYCNGIGLEFSFKIIEAFEFLSYDQVNPIFTTSIDFFSIAH